MDLVGADSNICNGIKPLAAVDANDDGGDKTEEHGETESLLASSANGGFEGKRQKSLRRNVQWNDRNGNRLVEVMEFEPSDSSDSEEDFNNNISFMEQALNRLLLCCCLGTQVSHS